MGCLQYYDATSGEIRSFNYKSDVDGTATNQLSNMNYAICIRTQHGFCGVRYSQVATDPFSFTVSGDADVSKYFFYVVLVDVLVGLPVNVR